MGRYASMILSLACGLLAACDGVLVGPVPDHDGGGAWRDAMMDSLPPDGRIKKDRPERRPDARTPDRGKRPPDTRPAPDAAAKPDQSRHKGTLLPSKLKITYYHLAIESEYSGPATEVIRDSSCKAIATVSKKFYDVLCIQGSGKLTDGRVVNYAKTCGCAAACTYGSQVCYVELSPKKFPWGAGAFSNPLVPLRSWAVDKSVIPLKTLLYAPAWDGVKIPKVSGLGGFTHDGCFRADDVGGGIKGWRFDFFSGTSAMYKALEKLPGGPFTSFSAFKVYKNPGRCAHLGP